MTIDERARQILDTIERERTTRVDPYWAAMGVANPYGKRRSTLPERLRAWWRGESR